MARLTTHKFFFFLVLCIAKTVAVSEQKCEKLDEKLWKPCVDLGFTHTFAIPASQNQTKLSVTFQKARSRHNSSVCFGEMTDMMLCSLYVPHCDISNDNRMVLPCKRVCAEYLHQCKVILRPDEVDMLTGPCNILLDDPKSKTCMEPTNFHATPEAMEILDGKCHEVLLPTCKRKYNYTILGPDAQKEIFPVFYGKNYTESAKDNDNLTHAFVLIKTNSSECRANSEFILCSQFLPPCFPHIGRSYYTVCQNTCRSLFDICSWIYKRIHVDFFCEHWAEGDDPSGFCKHNRWPSLWFWKGHKISEAPSETTPVVTESNYGWIAAAVLLPIVFALLIIGVMYYWKRYRLKRIAGYKPKQLINEEDQEQGEL